MTIDEFKYINPGIQFIHLLYSGSTVTAINISRTDCDNRNITQVLAELDRLLVRLNGVGYTFTVLNSEAFLTHYHFLIEEVTIPSIGTVPEGDCINITTVPSYQLTGFDKSEYQAILNNADFGRTTSYIFDVDRKKMEIQASNIELINNNSATLANFQELNYTSIGITNSRYAGSKTTVEDYGISPALGGLLIDAAIYSPSQTTSSICTLTINERILEEVIVGYDAATSPSFAGDVVYTDDIQINYTTVANRISFPNDLTPSTETIALFGWVDVNAGDIIRLEQGTLLREVIKVNEVTQKSLIGTTFTATRGYKSDINPSNEAVTFFDTGTINIKRLTGTQFYKADGNKLYKISNKKVWIKENTKVFYVDEEGQVIFELVTCSI